MALDAHEILRRESDPEHQKALLLAYSQIPDLVLEDLRNFIHPDELTYVADDPAGRRSAFAEGMRCVWIHVMKRRVARRPVPPIITKENQ